MQFHDQLGATVELAREPRRIVSLVPSQTELLFDLGVDEKIVGVTKFCTDPANKVAGVTREETEPVDGDSAHTPLDIESILSAPEDSTQTENR